MLGACGRVPPSSRSNVPTGIRHVEVSSRHVSEASCWRLACSRSAARTEEVLEPQVSSGGVTVLGHQGTLVTTQGGRSSVLPDGFKQPPDLGHGHPDYRGPQHEHAGYPSPSCQVSISQSSKQSRGGSDDGKVDSLHGGRAGHLHREADPQLLESTPALPESLAITDIRDSSQLIVAEAGTSYPSSPSSSGGAAWARDSSRRGSRSSTSPGGSSPGHKRGSAPVAASSMVSEVAPAHASRRRWKPIFPEQCENGDGGRNLPRGHWLGQQLDEEMDRPHGQQPDVGLQPKAGGSTRATGLASAPSRGTQITERRKNGRLKYPPRNFYLTVSQTSDISLDSLAPAPSSGVSRQVDPMTHNPSPTERPARRRSQRITPAPTSRSTSGGKAPKVHGPPPDYVPGSQVWGRSMPLQQLEGGSVRLCCDPRSVGNALYAYFSLDRDHWKVVPFRKVKTLEGSFLMVAEVEAGACVPKRRRAGRRQDSSLKQKGADNNNLLSKDSAPMLWSYVSSELCEDWHQMKSRLAKGAKPIGQGATYWMDLDGRTARAETQLLNKAVVLMCDESAECWQGVSAEDVHQFQQTWSRSKQLYGSILVYSSSRGLSSFKREWLDRQPMLHSPDVLVLSGGTSIWFSSPVSGWMEDTKWREMLLQQAGWNFDIIQSAAMRVVNQCRLRADKAEFNAAVGKGMARAAASVQPSSHTVGADTALPDTQQVTSGGEDTHQAPRPREVEVLPPHQPQAPRVMYVEEEEEEMESQENPLRIRLLVIGDMDAAAVVSHLLTTELEELTLQSRLPWVRWRLLIHENVEEMAEPGSRCSMIEIVPALAGVDGAAKYLMNRFNLSPSSLVACGNQATLDLVVNTGLASGCIMSSADGGTARGPLRKLSRQAQSSSVGAGGSSSGSPVTREEKINVGQTPCPLAIQERISPMEILRGLGKLGWL